MAVFVMKKIRMWNNKSHSQQYEILLYLSMCSLQFLTRWQQLSLWGFSTYALGWHWAFNCLPDQHNSDQKPIMSSSGGANGLIGSYLSFLWSFGCHWTQAGCRGSLYTAGGDPSVMLVSLCSSSSSSVCTKKNIHANFKRQFSLNKLKIPY